MKNSGFRQPARVSAFVLSLALLSVSFHSCFDSDDVGGAYYTFTGETVASLLQSDAYSNVFGEFCRALDTTEIMNLLATYGTFTVFAPIDTAMTAYYRDSITAVDPDATEYTLEKFLSQSPTRMDVLREMIYYQIIDAAAYLTSEFPEDHLAEKNMMSRYINVSYKNLDVTGYIIVNNNSDIVLKDKEVHNGVIHGVNRVLVPSKEFLAEKMASLPRFTVFAEALYVTKLSEKVLKIDDETYKQPTAFRNQSGSSVSTPKERLYWYTALAESNDLLVRKGIITDPTDLGKSINELRQYAAEVYDPIYPQYADLYDDPENENNSFNRFIAYHLFDHMAYDNGFVYNVIAYAEGYDVADYIVPMAPNALIETRERTFDYTVYDNNGQPVETTTVSRPVFNVMDDGSFVGLGNKIDDCQNGMIYELTDVLVYSEAVQREVFNKRLRIDVFALTSELMNLDLRPLQMGVSADKDMWFPGGYFDCLQYDDEQTKVNKPKLQNGSVQHQGGMFYMYGQFDFTLTVPNFPAGTWEVRIGIKHRGNALAQLYVDNRPAGVPVNLSETGKKYKASNYNPEIGWISDKSMVTYDEQGNEIPDEEAIAQNDKDMRNRGWMKAPASITQLPGVTVSARSESNSTRYILGQFEFGEDMTHTIRAKWVGEDQLVSDGDAYFGLDYLEFIPKSCIDSEDRN